MTISTRLFNYHAAERLFTQESSTLGANVHGWNTSRIHIPLTLISHKTGAKVVFKYVRTDYDGPSHEREVAGWRFRNDDLNLNLLIIND